MYRGALLTRVILRRRESHAKVFAFKLAICIECGELDGAHCCSA